MTPLRFAFLCVLGANGACAHWARHREPPLLIPSGAEICDTVQTDRSGPSPRLPTVDAVAPNRGAIAGIAVDTHVGTALPRATVRLSGRATAATLTDSLGGFSFRSLQPGQYVIRAVRLDYRPLEVSISVSAARTTTVALRLRLDACSMTRS